jgi:hypothetical protein
LKEQEKVLQSYLVFAEKEKETIISGDAVKLFHYRQQETEYINRVEAYSKVIPSFYRLYYESFPDAGLSGSGAMDPAGSGSVNSAGPGNTDPVIEDLKARISRLQTKLLLINNENRGILESKMGSIKKELDNLLKKRRVKPTPFRKIGNPSLIDTTA